MDGTSAAPPACRSGTPGRSLPRLAAHAIELPRLREHLDRWAPITVVRGMQGYGKTTQVGLWLRQQPDHVRAVWLQLGSRDEAGAGFGGRLLDELHGPRDDRLESPSEDWVRALDRAAAGTPPGGRLLLVIDNAHRLHDAAVLHGLLHVASRRDRFHLVLCSRGRHPIERLAGGSVELAVVPARVLLLTREETARLTARYGVRLAAEQLDELHATFGGWPAAIRLVLAETTPTGSELPLSRGRTYLSEVVVSEVRDRHALRELMRFSLAGRLTYSLIRDFAVDCDPERLLRTIESSGLAEREYEDDVVLVLPASVRGALRAEMLRHDPLGARAMHRRLSDWYAANSGPRHAVLAFEHAVAGQDWDRVDRVWTAHSADVGTQPPHELRDAVLRIPEPVLDGRPGLRVLRQLTVRADPGRHGGAAAPLREYGEASRHVAAQGLAGMRLHDLLYVGTGAVVGHRLAGELHRALLLADEIEQRAAGRLSAGEDPGDRLGWYHYERGMTQLLCLQLEQAGRSFRRSRQHRHETSPLLTGCAAAQLALLAALAGDPATARRRPAEGHAAAGGPPWARRAVEVSAHLAAGFRAYDRLDAAAWRTHVEALGDGSAPDELWPFVACLRAQYAMHHGDPLEALSVLNAAQAAQPAALTAGSAAQVLLGRARADLLLAMGQTSRARDELVRLDTQSRAVLAAPAARLELLSGRPGAARRIAAGLLWRNDTDPRSRLELLLISGQAALRTGDERAAADLARRSLALYRRTGALRPFSHLPPDELAAMLAAADDEFGAADRQRLAGEASPFPASLLTVRLTGRERLLAAALSHTGSRQQIADELYVSINTVKKQLATLYRKLSVQTREDALARLAELGLSAPVAVGRQTADSWRLVPSQALLRNPCGVDCEREAR